MYPKHPYPTVSAIVCTLNEEKNIANLLSRIPNWVDEVLLVDGHSTDRTISIAEKFRNDIKIYMQPNKGKGDALRCGITHATGDIIVTLDADGATNPEYMHKFVEPLMQGYDFVKGSRFSLCLPANKAIHRVFGNLLIAAVFNVLYLTKFTDLCSGYNAFWNTTLRSVKFESEDCYEDEPLLISLVKRTGFKIAEVGHFEAGRVYGESKAPSWRQGTKAIKAIIKTRVKH